jgi:predicted ArsR family transcriptional regulator
LNARPELRHNGVVKNVRTAGLTPAKPTPTGTPAASAAGPAGAHDDAPTRERVAASILENGPSTAAVLAQRLSLTPAAVRRHLDHLLAVGAVEAREPRSYGQRGRGRPAKVFVLTDSGRDTFFQAYDDLAASALRFLADVGGSEAVSDFARRRTAELEERYRGVVESAPPGERTEALARALTSDGYAASVQTAPVGDQLCQHHCPVAHVAAEFPQLCEAETEVFARLLGSHVQRLATIAHGDGVCTTNVPRADATKNSTATLSTAVEKRKTGDTADQSTSNRRATS